MLEQEGFGFYQRVLSKKNDVAWLLKMNEEAYKFFFMTPVKDRKYLVHTCNLWIESSHGHGKVMQHKVIPYKLCKNGNLWIGLCYMKMPSSEVLRKATIINTLTGDIFEYSEGTFFRSITPILTHEEFLIIECLAKGLAAKEMCLRLTFSLPTFKRVKKVLFKKIGVSTSAQAVSWAHSKGII